MQYKNELMQVGGLLLVLFVIAIITAVTYIGVGELNDTLCTQASSDYTFTNGVCVNSSDATQTVTAITKVNIVVLAIDVVLGLIGLIVIMLMFAIIIKVAKGFAKSSGGDF